MECYNSALVKMYSDVRPMSVNWLWYPYIPYGKITILQGDPGDGKSTMIMNIIAAVSTGGFTPDGKKIKKPQTVIYQCSEDGVADTIKPRLLVAGAACDKVAFIDEEKTGLSLDDENMRRAICGLGAKLLVVDPFQAYFGDGDLSNTMGVRKIMHRLGIWASLYDCAIVLIGHLNKNTSSKDLYRSLGSIDVMAAARSVLQVSCSEDKQGIKVLKQVKSSLAPKGKDICFRLDAEQGIVWFYNEENNSENGQKMHNEQYTKQELTAKLLHKVLINGPVAANAIVQYFSKADISERTVMLMKKLLGIKSFRKGGKWYWVLEGKN